MTVDTKTMNNGENTEERIPVNQRQVRACVERALRYERILSELRDLTGDSETDFDDLPDALAKLMADYADAAADANKKASEWKAKRSRFADYSNRAYLNWMAKLCKALGDFFLPAARRRPQMADVEASIRGLVTRYRARGLVIDALTREADGLRHKLTGRAAGEDKAGPAPVTLPFTTTAPGITTVTFDANQPLRDYQRDGAEQCRASLAKGKVAGVGKDEPTIVNEKGGKQSRLPYRCDLLPALATLAVCGVLDYGAAKYGPDNWKNIPVGSHLNHLLVHAFAFLAGDGSDAHLEHLATRALMALQLHLEAKEDAGGIDLQEAA